MARRRSSRKREILSDDDDDDRDLADNMPISKLLRVAVRDETTYDKPILFCLLNNDTKMELSPREIDVLINSVVKIAKDVVEEDIKKIGTFDKISKKVMMAWFDCFEPTIENLHITPVLMRCLLTDIIEEVLPVTKSKAQFLYVCSRLMKRGIQTASLQTDIAITNNLYFVYTDTDTIVSMLVALSNSKVREQLILDDECKKIIEKDNFEEFLSKLRNVTSDTVIVPHALEPVHIDALLTNTGGDATMRDETTADQIDVINNFFLRNK